VPLLGLDCALNINLLECVMSLLQETSRNSVCRKDILHTNIIQFLLLLYQLQHKFQNKSIAIDAFKMLHYSIISTAIVHDFDSMVTWRAYRVPSLPL